MQYSVFVWHVCSWSSRSLCHWPGCIPLPHVDLYCTVLALPHWRVVVLCHMCASCVMCTHARARPRKASGAHEIVWAVPLGVYGYTCYRHSISMWNVYVFNVFFSLLCSFIHTAIAMGLQKNYFKYGQSAREKIFGIPRDTRPGPTRSTTVGGGIHTTPLSMLISQGTKFNSSKYNQMQIPANHTLGMNPDLHWRHGDATRKMYST